MRKLILICIFSIVWNISFATIRTSLPMPHTPGEFNEKIDFHEETNGRSILDGVEFAYKDTYKISLDDGAIKYVTVKYRADINVLGITRGHSIASVLDYDCQGSWDWTIAREIHIGDDPNWYTGISPNPDVVTTLDNPPPGDDHELSNTKCSREFLMGLFHAQLASAHDAVEVAKQSDSKEVKNILQNHFNVSPDKVSFEYRTPSS